MESLLFNDKIGLFPRHRAPTELMMNWRERVSTQAISTAFAPQKMGFVANFWLKIAAGNKLRQMQWWERGMPVCGIRGARTYAG